MGKNQRKKNRGTARVRTSHTVGRGQTGRASGQSFTAQPPPPGTAAETPSAFEKPHRPAGIAPAQIGVVPLRAASPLTARPPRRKSPVPATVEVEEEHVPPHSCATGVLAHAEPRGLAATYAFDTSGWTSAGPVAIGFAGTRLDGTGAPGDRFERVERLADLSPGTGRVALTARLGHVAPGQWRIVAGPVENPAGHPLPRKAIVTSAQFALLAQGPGVRLFAWPALVGLGAVVAVLVQALLVARAGLPVAAVAGVTLVGCLAGFFGGKVWYLVLNHRPVREFLTSGACIQGFLLASLAVLVIGTTLLEISAGAVLDATAPGIFLGMAVGRPGCFLTGCCAGRPTTSRWGVWSSDRRLGIRRVPVQLFEAAVALLIGAAGLILVLAATAPFPGAVFAGATAAYTLARQFLFRLRENTHTRLGRLIVQLICGLALIGLLVAFAGA